MKLHRLICGVVATATFVAGGTQRVAAKHIDDADATKSLAAAHAAAKVAACEGAPVALVPALTHLDRMADGARHRQA